VIYYVMIASIIHGKDDFAEGSKIFC